MWGGFNREGGEGSIGRRSPLTRCGGVVKSGIIITRDNRPNGLILSLSSTFRKTFKKLLSLGNTVLS
jgi:hypothetical protein